MVGAGTTGTLHAIAWGSLPGVDVVSVVDPNEAAGRALAEHHGAAYSYSIEARLAEADVVSVCSPTRLHAEHMFAAADSSADVLLEKPAGTTAEELDRMIDVAAASGTRLTLRSVPPFCPELCQAKSWIERGRIGRVMKIFDTFSADRTWMPEWYFDPGISGGLLMIAAVHSLECLLWLTSAHSVEPSSAKVRDSGRGDIESHVSADLLLDGSLCHLEHSWRKGAEKVWEVEVIGERGTINIRPYYGICLVTGRDTEEVLF